MCTAYSSAYPTGVRPVKAVTTGTPLTIAPPVPQATLPTPPPVICRNWSLTGESAEPPPKALAATGIPESAIISAASGYRSMASARDMSARSPMKRMSSGSCARGSRMSRQPGMMSVVTSPTPPFSESSQTVLAAQVRVVSPRRIARRTLRCIPSSNQRFGRICCMRRAACRSPASFGATTQIGLCFV